MKRQTLAIAAGQGAGREQYRRPTKQDALLETMEQILPWQELCTVIEPDYPKAGKGRPPVGLERMVRMYFVQHGFNLADEACEDALLDSTTRRRFVGIDLGRERVPDFATLLKFRRKLEDKKLCAALSSEVGEVLQAKGMKVGTGTIVETTIIAAPGSTKNAERTRDPETHRTRKGRLGYFGMKMQSAWTAAPAWPTARWWLRPATSCRVGPGHRSAPQQPGCRGRPWPRCIGTPECCSGLKLGGKF